MRAGIHPFLKKIDFKRVFYHILFWVTINLVWDLASSYLRGRPLSIDFIVNDLVYFTPFQVFTVYVTLYYLFPKFLYKRKYYQFALFFILFFVGTIVLLVLPFNYSSYRDYMLELEKEADVYNFFRFYFFRMANLNLMLVGLASTIKLLRKWLETQKKQRILERETLEMNLRLQESKIKIIKSQINPDFLFDSLSTLYVLTQKKAEKAPDMVLKVSFLLDYMLYESNKDFVELLREIENIRNYIDIKRANPHNTAEILFQIEGDFAKQMIRPSILLPVVEDAFKFAKRSKQKIYQYNIRLELENNLLKLLLEGRTDTPIDLTALKQIYAAVRSVLDVQYGTLYQLEISQKDNIFQVNLVIQIKPDNYENKMPYH